MLCLSLKKVRGKYWKKTLVEDYWIGVIKTQGSIDVLIKEDNEWCSTNWKKHMDYEAAFSGCWNNLIDS